MKTNKTNAKFGQSSSISFSMGLVVALSLLLAAFEWSTEMKGPSIYSAGSSITEAIELDLNVKTPEPPKPEVQLPEPVSPDELIVKDEPVERVDMMASDDSPGQPIPKMPAIPEPPGGRVETPVETIWDFAEIAPEFAGGQAALLQFLSKAIRYPQADIDYGVEGRVICTFVVERDGSITDIHVLRGVSPTIDKEAIRVISQMPNWKPGFQNGKTVRVKFTLPILFRLNK